MAHRARPVLKAAAMCVVALTAALGLVGCAPTRSVSAYCAVVEKHKSRYLSAMANATNAGGLKGIVEAGAAIGDIESMWKELADVAPDQIKTDTETTRDAWAKMQEKELDRNFFAAAGIALISAGAMNRVNQFIADNCGVDAAFAPVGNASSATPTPSAPAAVATVRTLELGDHDREGEFDYGPHAVIAGDGGTSTTEPHFSSVAAADGKLVSGSGTVGPAGAGATLTQFAYGAQQEPDAAPDFVVAAVSHQPASGLTPQSWTTEVARYGAGASAPASTATFTGCNVANCLLYNIHLFGQVAVIGYADKDGTPVTAGIDMRSSAVVWSRRGVRSLTASGGLVIVQAGDPTNDTAAVRISGLNGETGAPAWDYRDAAGHTPTGWQGALGGQYGVIRSEPPGTSDSATRRVNVVDLSSGRTVGWRYGYDESAAYDPVNKQFALAGITRTPSGSNDDRSYEVWNEDGSVRFTIPHATFASLGEPAVAGALDGRVWIIGSDGPDIIRAATGEQDSTSPRATGATGESPYPQAVFGDVAVVSLDAGSATPTFPPLRHLASALVIDASGPPTRAEVVAAGG